MLIEVNRNHYINFQGKCFEPVKYLHFYMKAMYTSYSVMKWLCYNHL